MNASHFTQPPGGLLYAWERPRQRRFAIAAFLLASAALHAFCFYLFQIVYPPAISLLPPPAQVSVIAPTSSEARSFLNWLNAEDPALAAQTQRPADARAFQLPKVEHVPSYLAIPPTLKELPPRPAVLKTPAGIPPGPVPDATTPPSIPAVTAPTTLYFSEPLQAAKVAHPDLKFRASTREASQSARFRFAVDSLGAVRYAFLEQSSGDAALDTQARQALTLSRFEMPARPTHDLVWATATFEFGSDLALPPNTAERAP